MFLLIRRQTACVGSHLSLSNGTRLRFRFILHKRRITFYFGLEGNVFLRSYSIELEKKTTGEISFIVLDELGFNSIAIVI